MVSNIKFWKGKHITQMSGNNIFVYGANPEFRNGAGAAKAARKFGAKHYGGGRGIVGNTYGLVTKNLKKDFYEKETGITYKKTGERSVSPEMISDNINELYECAINNPDKKFFIAYTNDSRNLNGYSSKEMWDLFTVGKNVPDNIRFHESFRVLLKNNEPTKAAQIKREGMSKLKEAHDIAKETGNIKNNQTYFNYDEAINTNEQPRENFTFFWHPISPLSKWHPSVFKVKDITFISCEQFMMYCKAKLFKDENAANKIIELSNSYREVANKGSENNNLIPNNISTEFANDLITSKQIMDNEILFKEWINIQKEIRILGKEVENYNEDVWNKHKFSYAAKGNYEKFSQNENLKNILLSFNNTIIAEANPKDNIWSIGLREEDPNAINPSKWLGQNLSGKILTNLREKFKSEIKQNIITENKKKPKKGPKP